MTADATSPSQPPRNWWRIAAQIVLAPIVLPVGFLVVMVPLGIVAAISIPVTAILARVQAAKERRFGISMRQNKRFVEWQDLESKLSAGNGTLIIEQANKCPVRVWWTPDDVLMLAPAPPPAKDELDILGLRPPHPFVAWCFERYCHPEVGHAFLTTPTLGLPPGLYFASFFKERYPKMTVIDTVYCWRRETRTAA